MAKAHNSRFKQAWEKCKRYHLHRLGENTNISGINIRKPCLEQANNMLQEYNIAKQGMDESSQSIEQKFLNNHEPKRIRRYDGTHVNIASFVTDFRLSRKTEHDRNINM